MESAVDPAGWAGGRPDGTAAGGRSDGTAAGDRSDGTTAGGRSERSAASGAHAPGGRRSADVLVIGGGVIGLAISWRAAQRGLRVILADPAPGRGASYAAAGMLTPVTEAAYAERELFDLGLESLRLYPAFAAELSETTGTDVGFRQTGTLAVGYDADDMALLAEHALLRETFGAPVERLTSRECRRAEPMLGPAISGGLLVADDASVDPRRLTSALLAAAIAHGVSHLPVSAVRLRTAGDRAEGAELADGTLVTASQVVLCAGWASASLAGLPPPAAPPVRPVKGQIVRLRPAAAGRPSGLPGCLLTKTVRAFVQGSPVYLVPRQDGELVLGATQEELGADTTVTAGGVWQLLRDARAIVPGITELEFAEAAAGLRPGTPDNAPVLGPSALPGLVLATGHFRGGVLLAPVTGNLIADFLADGTMAAAAAPFSAGRFERQEVPWRSLSTARHTRSRTRPAWTGRSRWSRLPRAASRWPSTARSCAGRPGRPPGWPPVIRSRC